MNPAYPLRHSYGSLWLRTRTHAHLLRRAVPPHPAPLGRFLPWPCTLHPRSLLHLPPASLIAPLPPPHQHTEGETNVYSLAPPERSGQHSGTEWVLPAALWHLDAATLVPSKKFTSVKTWAHRDVRVDVTHAISSLGVVLARISSCTSCFTHTRHTHRCAHTNTHRVCHICTQTNQCTHIHVQGLGNVSHDRRRNGLVGIGQRFH